MVTIAHYEVYTDNGEGWRLEGRFAADQRYEAVGMAKEKEQSRLKVKIIKELFDVQDNSYQETIEYVSGLGGIKEGTSNSSSGNIPELKEKNAFGGKKNISAAHYGPSAGAALLKLVLIIFVCLVLVNFLVTLLTPVVEAYAPEDITRPILFAIFFTLFLGMTIPLLLKKVPWQAFSGSKSSPVREVKEKKIYTRAEHIIKWYSLNDDNDPSIAPVFPEAPLEYKKYIVSFLTEIISHVNSNNFLQDSFSKLGIKLIVFGGCMELSRYSGLRFSQANSLLYESFNILDGTATDLEAFYEAKRSYNDNRVAIYLTGVGAFLMAQIIAEQPLDENLLKKSFARWEGLNTQVSSNIPVGEPIDLWEEASQESDVFTECQLNIQIGIEFQDIDHPKLDEKEENIRGEIRNIIYNLLRKYNGQNVIEDGRITSVIFSRLNHALDMSVEFYRDIAIYQNEQSDTNIAFHNRCAVVEAVPDGAPNLSDYANGVLQQTFDDEIVTTEPLKVLFEEANLHKYSFEFLGEKSIDKSGKKVALYKIIY